MGTNFRTYILMGFASTILFLCTLVTRNLSLYHAAYIESICFFALTWLFADKAIKGNTSMKGIIIAVIVGRLIMEVPLRIISLHNINLYNLIPITSFIIPHITCASILLAALCRKEQRPSTYFLATIIIILLCSVGHNFWLEHMLVARNGVY